MSFPALCTMHSDGKCIYPNLGHLSSLLGHTEYTGLYSKNPFDSLRLWLTGTVGSGPGLPGFVRSRCLLVGGFRIRLRGGRERHGANHSAAHHAFLARRPGCDGLHLYRKLRDGTAWGYLTDLAANATNYVDTNVAAGGAYEYRISKSATGYSGEGYIYAGMELPVVESRGKVVLLVDNTSRRAWRWSWRGCSRTSSVTAGRSCAMTWRAWRWIRPIRVTAFGLPGPTNSPASKRSSRPTTTPTPPA